MINFSFSLQRNSSFGVFLSKRTIRPIFQCLLREKCLYSEFFWSIFPRIWTEYGEFLCVFRLNTDQKNSEYGHFSRSEDWILAVLCFSNSQIVDILTLAITSKYLTNYLSLRFLYRYNHRQGIVDKFTKLSKLGVSLECFATSFLQFSSRTVKIWPFNDRLRTCHQLKGFQGFFWNFPIS